MSFKHRQHAFTLIELLVTLAVIGVLLALIIPAVQSAREAARRTACASNLRQLCLAMHQYEATYRVYPPGVQVQAFSGPQSYSKSFGWPVVLLPFVEQQALFQQFNTNLDCQIHHRQLTRQQIPVYRCPSDPLAAEPTEDLSHTNVDPMWGDFWKGSWGTLNYLGVSGITGGQIAGDYLQCELVDVDRRKPALHVGMFFGNSSVRSADLLDGSSQTLMFGERGVVFGWGKWGGSGQPGTCPAGFTDVTLPGVMDRVVRGGLRQPVGDDSDRQYWWSHHRGGTHLAAADGSVKVVSSFLDRDVLQALSTRAFQDHVGEW